MEAADVPLNKLNPLIKQNGDSEGTQALNLLDTVISDEDSVSEEGVNEILMNGVKRILSVPSVEAQGDAIEPAIRTTKRAKKVIPVVTPVVKLKKKSPRKKARRFPVSFEKSKIWSKLVNTSSDISMAEWLSLDKEAAAEVIDGIRFLRESRIKRKSKAVTEIQNSGNQNLVMNIEVDSNSDSEGSSMISYGDANSEFSGNSSVISDISSSLGSEITETDLEFSDEESVYRYAYDLKKIKSGSPLRGVISINNVQVEAVFDTGASLSLISEELCAKLGLVTNGDKVQLVGFNSEHGPTSSSMVMDVPIAIVSKNGKLNIRPEHMAVQIGGSGNTCLIGIPWFDNYNVSLDIKKALVCIPTTTGMVKLQCTTTHSTQSINSVGLNERFRRFNSREEKEIYQVGIAQQCTVLPEEELIPMGDEDNKVELEITGDNIADGIVADLADIIQEFKDCFSEVSGLGTIKGYKAIIKLKEGAEPVRCRPFRLGWHEQELVKKYIEEMIELGIIEPASGVFTSPLFLIDKRGPVSDNNKRVLVDFRKVNEMIVKENFAVPTVSEITEAVSGMKVFSCCDLASGYFQLGLDEENSEVTGFTTHMGCYKFKKLPMGITIGCSSFQHAMYGIFKELVEEGSLYIFLDDLLLVSPDMESHKVLLRRFLSLAREYDVRLKRKKCHFGEDSVEYLGHVLGKEGSSPSNSHIARMKDFPEPTNATEVRSFLGLANYFSKYICGYSELCKPLCNLTRKNSNFVWSETCQENFMKIRLALISKPLLAYPDKNKVQIVTCDSSDFAISVVVTQVDSMEGLENEEVISYGSRLLTDTEVKMHIHHKEALALVYAVNKYKHWLRGRKFVLVTDHHSLLSVFGQSKLSPKLTRWAACLLSFDYVLKFRPGKLNPADPLSRKVVELQEGDVRDIIKIV